VYKKYIHNIDGKYARMPWTHIMTMDDRQ